MPKIIDLTGEKYGRLTVLSLSEKRYRNALVWKCQCECGNIIYVPTSSLKNGGTKSCGCLNIDRLSNRIENLIGQKFGNLTVVEKTEKRYHENVVWKCRCDCGNYKEVTSVNLKKGSVISCGCELKKSRQRNAQKAIHDGTVINRITNIYNGKTNNRFGTSGITLNRYNKYVVRIGFQGKRYYIGTFDNLKEAIEAREKAEKTYWEETINKFNTNKKK